MCFRYLSFKILKAEIKNKGLSEKHYKLSSNKFSLNGYIEVVIGFKEKYLYMFVF